MDETITLGTAYVTVRLPVQYRQIKGEDGSITTFDLRIGGTISLYESLPQEVKIAIAEAVAREVRK